MEVKKLLFSSLRTKLLIMFILLTVIPLIFVGMISYVKSVEIVSENAKATAEIEVAQLSQELDVKFQDAIRFTEITKQESTISFLNNINEDTYEEAKSILNMFTFYREIIPSSENILDVTIISPTGQAISESRGVYELEIVPLHDPQYNEVLKHPSSTIVTNTMAGEKNVISITRPIIWDITYEVIGFINILLDASVVEDIIEDSMIGATGSLFITSEQEELLFYLKKDESIPLSDFNDSQINEFNMWENALDDSVFVINHTSDMTGWNLISYLPEREIMNDANEIRSLIFVSVVSSIFFTITLYYFISSKLIRPVRDLKEKMKLASSGNLDAKVVNKSSDEIADLGLSFNTMILKIKMLLQKSVEEEKQLKRAELRALQAQINPHFLYNTLDTIIWMAEDKKSKDVISVTKALSQFFRISLSKGKDLITIAEEIEHVENYLIIQKSRYRDILDVTININEEIHPFIILKLTLQPIVENAIYHGIKNKRGKGLLSIEGGMNSQGNIYINVVDNGIGMNDERLNEIRKQLTLEIPLSNNKGGFGMINVQQRIRLFYGEPFGINIESNHGIGTKVSLIIPAER
ncbi:sensor histidine kinase [Salipaludibacillus sp. HK11]|uniref:sensor histidine kinase n=1 Tax=Salipaludibacillus sp. HK11 TaxID=3394320 RepID=UPI0039FCAADA